MHYQMNIIQQQILSRYISRQTDNYKSPILCSNESEVLVDGEMVFRGIVILYANCHDDVNCIVIDRNNGEHEIVNSHFKQKSCNIFYSLSHGTHFLIKLHKPINFHR